MCKVFQIKCIRKFKKIHDIYIIENKDMHEYMFKFCLERY